ncbi:MAG: low temperature requirement protein A [Gaiellaceae bacterium]
MGWLYFDVAAIFARRRLVEARGLELDRLARHVYSYLHRPMVADVVLFAFGLETTLHPVGDAPRWLTETTSAGEQRLAKPDDYVRIEVSAALAHDKQVIPVLVGGAAMPTLEELPEGLEPLALRQAVALRDASWRQDVDGLIRSACLWPCSLVARRRRPCRRLARLRRDRLAGSPRRRGRPGPTPGVNEHPVWRARELRVAELT